MRLVPTSGIYFTPSHTVKHAFALLLYFPELLSLRNFLVVLSKFSKLQD